MAFAVLLSEWERLSLAEKLRAIQQYACEFEIGGTVTRPTNMPGFNSECEVWSPQDEGGAVAALNDALRQSKTRIWQLICEL